MYAALLTQKLICLFVDSFVGATALYEKYRTFILELQKNCLFICSFAHLFVCSFVCATTLKEHLSCSFSAAVLTHIH